MDNLRKQVAMSKRTAILDATFTARQKNTFWARVSIEGECWVWDRPNPDGYGSFSAGKLSLAAHRAAYIMMVGPIPEGLELDHLCRVRACVNPEHLDPVTPKVNSERRVAAKETCAQGHPWTEENAAYYSGGSREPVRRYCLPCTRIRAKRSMDKLRRSKGVPVKGSQTHCKRGHEFTPENTYVAPNKPGRNCRQCQRDAGRVNMRRRRARLKAAN